MKRFLGFLVPILVCFSVLPAYPQSLDPEVRAAIREFADDICGVYMRSGGSNTQELRGEAKASVDGLIGKLVDLGVEGAATFEEEKYTNVVRDDIAEELQDIRSCRIEIWKDLKDTLIVVRQRSDVQPLEREAPIVKVGLDIPRDYEILAFPSFDCSKASTAAEMVLCSHKGAAAADIQLSSAYQIVRKGLDREARNSLKDTQIQWQSFRDASCLKGQEFRRLTDALLEEVGTCIAGLTLDRTAQLNAMR